MKAIRLYESPELKLQLPEGAKALSLEKMDSAKGYADTQVHVKRIMELAAKIEKEEASYSDVIGAIKLWFIYLFGKNTYDEIFNSDRRRDNYRWHEDIFMSAQMAISESRASFMQAASNSPVIKELKGELLQQLMENEATAAIMQGGKNV